MQGRGGLHGLYRKLQFSYVWWQSQCDLSSSLAAFSQANLQLYERQQRFSSTSTVSQEASSVQRRHPLYYALWGSVCTTVIGGIGMFIYLGAGIYQQRAEIKELESKGWVQALSKNATYTTLVSPSSSIRSTLTKRDYDDPDHLMSSMLEANALREMLCFYSEEDKVFHMVVQLGRQCCGYPQTTHGGMTAALFDEAFGGMYFSLVKAGLVAGPGYTAHLEVDYKQKLAAGQLLLITVELESAVGRKIWMTATAKDEPNGAIRATARALFVIPRIADYGKRMVERLAGNVLQMHHPDEETVLQPPQHAS